MKAKFPRWQANIQCNFEVANGKQNDRWNFMQLVNFFASHIQSDLWQFKTIS